MEFHKTCVFRNFPISRFHINASWFAFDVFKGNKSWTFVNGYHYYRIKCSQEQFLHNKKLLEPSFPFKCLPAWHDKMSPGHFFLIAYRACANLTHIGRMAELLSVIDTSLVEFTLITYRTALTFWLKGMTTSCVTCEAKRRTGDLSSLSWD